MNYEIQSRPHKEIDTRIFLAQLYGFKPTNFGTVYKIVDHPVFGELPITHASFSNTITEFIEKLKSDLYWIKAEIIAVDPTR